MLRLVLCGLTRAQQSAHLVAWNSAAALPGAADRHHGILGTSGPQRLNPALDISHLHTVYTGHQRAQDVGKTAAATKTAAPTWQSQQHGQYRIVQYSRGNQTTLAVTGSNSTVEQYQLHHKKEPEKVQESTSSKKHSTRSASIGSQLFLRPLKRVRKILTAFCLPSGYPSSVGSNYLQYTLWQAVTNFATTANGVLASTFLLYSVGLGAGAIPTAGALNWVLKDGLGQMGTLLFGKAIAHNFDIHSKTWYFMSFALLSTATGQ